MYIYFIFFSAFRAIKVTLSVYAKELSLLHKHQAPVIRKVDNTIHWISHYPAVANSHYQPSL